MVLIGYHASHEQLPPSALLRAVAAAERAGFDGAMCSDHLSPWTTDQGESGHALSWLGAALARTSFSIGSVQTPGQLHHPVVTAHATATLEEMFPGRTWSALGSGEKVNEHVTGDPWPAKDERTARLRECVDVMRRLYRGERVTHDGRVRVHEARLWSRPETPPPLLATGVSVATARGAAEWADGFLTVGTEAAELRELVEAYRGADGRGDLCLQVHIHLTDDLSAGLEVVREQWRHDVIDPPLTWDIEQPEDFERMAGDPTDDELAALVLLSDDADDLARRIAELVATGFDRVYLHDISKDQDAFLRRAERRLLPALRRELAERGTTRPSQPSAIPASAGRLR